MCFRPCKFARYALHCPWPKRALPSLAVQRGLAEMPWPMLCADNKRHERGGIGFLVGAAAHGKQVSSEELFPRSGPLMDDPNRIDRRWAVPELSPRSASRGRSPPAPLPTPTGRFFVRPPRAQAARHLSSVRWAGGCVEAPRTARPRAAPPWHQGISPCVGRALARVPWAAWRQAELEPLAQLPTHRSSEAASPTNSHCRDGSHGGRGVADDTALSPTPPLERRGDAPQQCRELPQPLPTPTGC